VRVSDTRGNARVMIAWIVTFDGRSDVRFFQKNRRLSH